jgi:hypothetical protein
MHPAIIQAAAAERTRDLHTRVAAHRRAAEIRRSRRAQHPQPVMNAQRAGREASVLGAPRAA